MGRFLPVINESARHPLRRRLRPPIEVAAATSRGMHEDIAFFLVSFASAFIILYGFVI
jgi:hypothetical protein